MFSLVFLVATAFADRTLPVQILPRVSAANYKSFEIASNAPKKAKYRIGIIDTGYDSARAYAQLKLCKSGHYDFYSDSEMLASTASHGTFVGAIIAEALEKVDYCAVIYQAVDKDGHISPESVARAIMRASKENLTAVNLSLTGPNSSLLEQRALRALSDSGATIFVAAGNEKKNLTDACASFPACYSVPNLFIVGALTDDLQQPAQYSNYGTRVNLWYQGRYFDGVTLAQGTSFASPRALADYILSLSSPLPTH